MNNRPLLQALAVSAVVLAVAAAIAIGAYNAGVAHGVAEAAQVVAPPAAGTPVIYPYGWGRPAGFGFFPVFPLLFILFFVFVLRRAFWGGPWRRACYYHGQPAPASPPPAANQP